MTERSLRTRPDRIISLARLAVAGFAIAAVWIDPSQPTVAPFLTYSVLAAYAAFAAAAAIWVRVRGRPTESTALTGHLVDVAVFAFLVFSTEGPTSPFFLFFTFAMISATFRWRWRGALWTTLAALALLFVSAAGFIQFAPVAPWEADRFLIRCSHFIVIGAMLVYFGFHREQLSDEIARLTTWRPDPLAARKPGDFLRDCAVHVSEVFDAPRVLIAVSETEEPWATVACWEANSFRRDRLDLEMLAHLVPKELREVCFLREGPGTEVLLLSHDASIRTWNGDPIAPEFRRKYRVGRLLSVPLRSEGMTGRMFILDPAELSTEDLPLAALVSGQIAGGLDRLAMVEVLRRSSAAEERVQLARDLHDGVLQTLTGVALQLEGIAGDAGAQAGAVQARIRGLQDGLLAEQRDLRALIRQMRPGSPLEPGRLFSVQPDLIALVENLQQQWDLSVHLSCEPPNLMLSAKQVFQLQRMTREAAANAARHGGASRLSIDVTANEREVTLDIRDDGRGMPVHGSFDQDRCAELQIGPRSLRERVTALGGSFRIQSDESGVCLVISIPRIFTGVFA